MMASTESGRGEKIEDLPGGKHNDTPGEKYRVGRTDIEESTTEITKWSREETEESASEGGDRDRMEDVGGRNEFNDDGRGTRGKRSGNRSRGHIGRQRRHIGRDYRCGRCSKSGGLTWGVKTGKLEG